MLDIASVPRATQANRDALPKCYHTVYRHIGENEGTLDWVISQDLGWRTADMRTLSFFVVFDVRHSVGYLSEWVLSCKQNFRLWRCFPDKLE